MPMNIYYANQEISNNARRLLEINGIKFTDNKLYIDIIYCQFEKINFKHFPNLRYVLCPCTNINHLNIPLVGNYPHVHIVEIIYLDSPRFLYDNVHSTAETTLWGIIKLLKPGLTSNNELYSTYEIRNKRIGIIGVGRVGQQIAHKLYGLGAKIILYDTHYSFYNEDPPYEKCYKLDHLLYTSEIITVHTIADETTKNLIDRVQFDKMVLKPWFVNTSRGSVVNGEALLRAARLRQIKGFYIDVMDSYSLETKLGLTNLTQKPNFITTRHKAGSSIESREQTDLYVVNSLLNKLKLKEEDWR